MQFVVFLIWAVEVLGVFFLILEVCLKLKRVRSAGALSLTVSAWTQFELASESHADLALCGTPRIESVCRWPFPRRSRIRILSSHLFLRRAGQ